MDGLSDFPVCVLRSEHKKNPKILSGVPAGVEVLMVTRPAPLLSPLPPRQLSLGLLYIVRCVLKFVEEGLLLIMGRKNKKTKKRKDNYPVQVIIVNI